VDAGKENIQNKPDDTESEAEDKIEKEYETLQQQKSSEEYSDDCLLTKLNNTIGNIGELSSKKLQYLD